jgi:serine/threonine protein phosphatase PrpC
VRLRYGACTDVGQVRKINEDALLTDPPLFAVADGMGGHDRGEVASGLAVETLASLPDPDTRPVDAWLSDGVAAANEAVYRRGAESTGPLRMGTTLTAAYAAADAVYLAHVGDSRAYLLHDGKLRQLTDDHSLVAEWVREGRINADEAAAHPQRSVITRAIGIDAAVQVAEYRVVPEEGDRLLLCSDGLSGFVDDASIAEVLTKEPNPDAAARKLVEKANGNGGEDNITAVVIDILEGPAAAPATSAGQPARLETADSAGAGAAPTDGPVPATDQVAQATPDFVVDSQAAESAQTLAPTAPYQAAQALPEETKRRWPVIAAVLGLIVLVGAVAVIVLALRDDDDTSATKSGGPEATAGSEPEPDAAQPQAVPRQRGRKDILPETVGTDFNQPKAAVSYPVGWAAHTVKAELPVETGESETAVYEARRVAGTAVTVFASAIVIDKSRTNASGLPSKRRLVSKRVDAALGEASPPYGDFEVAKDGIRIGRTPVPTEGPDYVAYSVVGRDTILFAQSDDPRATIEFLEALRDDLDEEPASSRSGN